MLNNIPWLEILNATGQTLYMVFISSFVSILLGLGLGILLFNTRKEGLCPQKILHEILNAIVNVGRSVPYIILMIALIPFTRFIVGTSIGINAAIVSLTVAAIPFYARIAEGVFSEVSVGLIEVGHTIGATRRQIIFKILLPESFSGLVKGATLTIISLIGYSAMAGAVGGGGLGELAINYGYQRFDVTVMLMTVVLLVVLVQWAQWLGNMFAKRPNIRWILGLSLVFWILCFVPQFGSNQDAQTETLRLGIMTGVDEKIMAVAQKIAWDRYHLNLKLITFDDYVLPNTALNSGAIDANIFQHVPYLEAQNKARHYKLVPIAKTFIYPMGFYSRKYHNLQSLSAGATIAIPNDPSNEGRALLVLEKAGLIRLTAGVGLKATLRDIRENEHQFKFIAMDAAQIPRALPDVAMGALTNDYVGPAGFTVNDALAKEGTDSPYVNVIVVREQDKNKPIFKKLISVIHSQPVLEETLKVFPNGAAIAGWDTTKK